MLRLFTGIDLAPELKLSLSALTGGLPGARWVDPGNYHVTLRFIGEVDEALAADIDAALARIEVPRFEIALAGIGTFGERQLWVGVERNDALIRLRDKIESTLVRLRLEPEAAAGDGQRIHEVALLSAQSSAAMIEGYDSCFINDDMRFEEENKK